MILFWTIIAAIFIIIDMATSNFLFVFFVVGAVGAMVAEVFNLSIGLQVLIFLFLNLITISIGYPITKEKFNKNIKRTPLMEETYIGRVMEATEDIKDRAKVKVDGIYWTVQNYGEEIKYGEKFKIVGIEGIKLIIEKEKGI